MDDTFVAESGAPLVSSSVWIPPPLVITLFVGALGLLFGLVTALVMFVWPEQRPGRPMGGKRSSVGAKHSGGSCPCC